MLRVRNKLNAYINSRYRRRLDASRTARDNPRPHANKNHFPEQV